MKELLWISKSVPYDTVAHAGGKNENYYIKGIKKIGNFSISLLTFAQQGELKYIDLDRYGIDTNLIIYRTGILKRFWGILRRLQSWNIFDRRGGFVEPFVRIELRSRLRKIKNRMYPDIIIIQWTQLVLCLDLVKKVFPCIPIVAYEEDVSYLSFERKFKYENNLIKKLLRKRLYENLQKEELANLEKYDLVVVNNKKDYDLLGVDNPCIQKHLMICNAYFQSFVDEKYIGGTKDIIYYGFMGRPENYNSAIWFIEKVFKHIEDEDVRFIIVGKGAPDKLLKYVSDRIIMTGYVDDVFPYFKNAMCMVAPLVLGAGVKIKILEGLSAGIPILTNNIGIEGIEVMDRVHYIHCEKPSEYLKAIDDLINGHINISTISNNAKAFINESYNLEDSLKNLNKTLCTLCLGQKVNLL